MSLFRTRLITILIAFGCIITALIGGGLYYFELPFNWTWFAGVSCFFLVLESIIVSYVEGVSREKNKKKMLSAYMLTKIVKVILSLILVTIYALGVKENTKIFVGAFVSFYLLYLVIEAILFIQVEKHIKENRHNE